MRWSAGLVWRIEINPAAARELQKLDPPVARRITGFLRDRLAMLDDPRSIGEALKGASLGELWKYRVGDLRVIASIEDQTVTVLVLQVGNRRAIYR